MNSHKNSTLTLRIDPAFKQGLKAAAEQEHRSITNMVEVLIRDYCQQHNIAIRTPASVKSQKGSR